MYKIYDFECAKCGKVAEMLIESSTLEHVKCGTCGGSVKKLIAAPPFHLKGSVWAKDNYGLSKDKKH